MNKGDQGKTNAGHLVVFESLSSNPGMSHPLEGYINLLYPGVEWSKCCWTLMGKINVQGPESPLDLNWDYYVQV